MNRMTAFVTAAALAATAATSVVAAPLGINLGLQFNNQQQYQHGAGIGIQIGTPVIRDALRANACVDLRVDTAQHTNADGSIGVSIRVANASGVDYVSYPGQQMLVINGSNGGHSANVPFDIIRTGESVVWTDTFHPFEFPASYHAQIVFDPDIRTDGNPYNDDCHPSNNSGALTTAR